MAPLAKPFPCLARPRNSESVSEFPGRSGGSEGEGVLFPGGREEIVSANWEARWRAGDKGPRRCPRLACDAGLKTHCSCGALTRFALAGPDWSVLTSPV